MNKFIGIGRLTNDIELKETNNGKLYTKNSLAIKNDFKNVNGQYDTEFINIVVWGKSAEVLCNYSSKGMQIAIEGRVCTRDYDKNDGTKGYITEVICEKIKLLESKKDNNKKTETEDIDPYAEFGEQIDVEDNFLD